MSSSTIQQVYVAGAGHMGHGIAQVIATAGVGVTLYDINDAALNAGLDKIRWSLAKLHEKAKLTQTPDAVMARIRPTTALQPAATAQLVIEVVPEREPIKRELFTGLDAICPPQVIFASNTSAIPITQLAAVTKRPDRFCGLHFFGPVQLMALVEVIRGLGTSDATVSAAMEFARRIGKTPVLVQRDAAGFIVNRVLMAAIGEAARLAESGLATPGPCRPAATGRWARWRPPTWPGSTSSCTPSRRSTPTRTTRSSIRRRSCAGWCRPATWVARPARGSTTMPEADATLNRKVKRR
jgi:3-hydroxyacyl-CoA dehydrogenase